MSFAFSVGYKFNLLARCLTRTETRTPAPSSHPPCFAGHVLLMHKPAVICLFRVACSRHPRPLSQFHIHVLITVYQLSNCIRCSISRSKQTDRQTEEERGRGWGSLDICMPHRTINENFRICQSIITSTDSTDPGMGSTELRFCCVVNYVACCGCYFISSSLGPSSAGCSPSRCRNQIAARRGKPRRVELAAPRRCSPLGGMNLSYE